MEKKAWEIMMSAHYKWEKNHGSQLQDFISFYFSEIYIDVVNEIIEKETEVRLKVIHEEEYFCSEDEFVVNRIDENIDWWNDDEYYEPLDFQEIAEEIKEWLDEYREVQEEIQAARENTRFDVQDELRLFYYNFFNAPETLTVIYNDEVIQGKSRDPA